MHTGIQTEIVDRQIAYQDMLLADQTQVEKYVDLHEIIGLETLTVTWHFWRPRCYSCSHKSKPDPSLLGSARGSSVKLS